MFGGKWLIFVGQQLRGIANAVNTSQSTTDNSFGEKASSAFSKPVRRRWRINRAS
ncbi:hypothetical protein HFN60_29665 [Rhizobium leguminosarum]|uniref:hypothetical protein n=1 Tax=Rhizobium leguminosarum TaxID=384 RepID=UPI001C97505E|nr:hypothetical protein [Rhizobium leguminosarum]MBY5819762.1 hypothetical protein [Rhizobium leguminosarum]